MRFLGKFFCSWQRSLFLLVVGLMAYYPVSALLSEKIDRSDVQQFEDLTDSQSQGVEVMKYLLNREVNEHLWTSNLPYFFSASCLDNMPNFQVGILRSLAEVAEILHTLFCIFNTTLLFRELHKNGDFIGIYRTSLHLTRQRLHRLII